jgi:hypothetical protein
MSIGQELKDAGAGFTAGRDMALKRDFNEARKAALADRSMDTQPMADEEQHFAAGGLVEDDDPARDDMPYNPGQSETAQIPTPPERPAEADAAPQEAETPAAPEKEAVPTRTQAPAPAQHYMSPAMAAAEGHDRDRSMERIPGVDRESQLTGAALHGGISFLQDFFGLNQHHEADQASSGPNATRALPTTAGNEPPAGDHQSAVHALFSGVGATNPKDWQQVEHLVDPNGELDQGIRTISGLNSVYEYWLKKGDVTKANKAAASILQMLNLQVAKLGDVAEKSIRAGDYHGGTQALIQANDKIPDGLSMQATTKPDGSGVIRMVDTNGKVVMEGPYSKEQLLAVAIGAKSGTLFYDQLTQAASRFLPRQTPNGPVSDAFNKFITENGAPGGDPTVNPEGPATAPAAPQEALPASPAPEAGPAPAAAPAAPPATQEAGSPNPTPPPTTGTPAAAPAAATTPAAAPPSAPGAIPTEVAPGTTANATTSDAPQQVPTTGGNIPPIQPEAVPTQPAIQPFKFDAQPLPPEPTAEVQRIQAGLNAVLADPNTDAKQRAEAARLARDRIGQIWQTYNAKRRGVEEGNQNAKFEASQNNQNDRFIHAMENSNQERLRSEEAIERRAIEAGERSDKRAKEMAAISDQNADDRQRQGQDFTREQTQEAAKRDDEKSARIKALDPNYADVEQFQQQVGDELTSMKNPKTGAPFADLLTTPDGGSHVETAIIAATSLFRLNPDLRAGKAAAKVMMQLVGPNLRADPKKNESPTSAPYTVKGQYKDDHLNPVSQVVLNDGTSVYILTSMLPQIDQIRTDVVANLQTMMKEAAEPGIKDKAEQFAIDAGSAVGGTLGRSSRRWGR